MVKSFVPDVIIPEVPIHQLVFQAMKMYSNRMALVDGITEKGYTYSEVYDRIRRVASGLKRLGLRQGEIFAILSPNSPEYVFVFYAVLACGASVTTINPVYKADEMSKLMQDSKARFLFTSLETVKTAMEAASKVNIKQTVIVCGRYPGCIQLSELLADDGSLYPEHVDIDVRNDVAVIPYSSGTTGFPKGVMITHYNLVAMLVQISHPEFGFSAAAQSTQDQEVTLSFVPFFHVFGMVGLVISQLLIGSKLIILPRFVPERFLALIQKYKVTSLPLVPPVVVFLVKSPLPKKYDLSSIKKIMCGAAPLSKETTNEFIRKMGVPQLKQGYGMTETTVACTYPPGNRPIKPGSCGMLLPNMEMQIVDPETKNILGANQRGEIWVKGPNIMKGYLNRPEATRETLDSNGWLHTGDIGYYDSDGYLFIVDRLKELIKYKGFQVAPAELEALILNHPDVADVAVIGIPDEEAGELPKAFVVRKSGRMLTEDDLKKYVSDRVSSFKHLRGGVQFTDVIPKSQAGKILRQQLKQMVAKSKL